MNAFIVFRIECRRCLARRAVRVLVGVALLGCLAAGVFGAAAGGELDLTTNDPALIRLADLWRSDEPVLAMPLILLGLGALLGGALVAGGEWKAGTVPTVLTWEPRRRVLLGARVAACGAMAVTIAAVLLVTFVVVGVLPGVVAHGEVGDIGGDWLRGLAGGVTRGLVLVGLAGSFGAAIASIGRSTTAALAAVFVYEAAFEPIARALWTERSGWLLSENAVAWVTGVPVEYGEYSRSVLSGGATLVVYVAIAAAAALVVFQRRDVAA